MLEDIDILIFDIQDVGSRFYTYISTLFYAVQAASENNIPLIVLDRPNPINGVYVDGPVRKKLLHALPGMRVVYPADSGRRQGLLRRRSASNPVVFLEHELLYNSKGRSRTIRSSCCRLARPMSCARERR